VSWSPIACCGCIFWSSGILSKGVVNSKVRSLRGM